jgi:diguanylate cyclase
VKAAGADPPEHQRSQPQRSGVGATDTRPLSYSRISFDLACNICTAAVLSVAEHSGFRAAWRAGVGLPVRTMVGNLAVTAAALGLAATDQRFIIALPAAALTVHQAYQSIGRIRSAQLFSQQFADAISSLNRTEEDEILTQAALSAAALLSADAAQVMLADATTSPRFLGPQIPPGLAKDCARFTQTVDIGQPDTDEPLAQLQVHFSQPPRITRRHRHALHGLAAAAHNAIAAARANSAARKLATELAYQATHDPATQLPRRDRYLAAITAALDHARTDTRRPAGAALVGLIVIRIAEINEINDVLGDHARALLARHAADQLRHSTRAEALIGHLDEERLAVFLPDATDLAGLRPHAEHLLAAIATPTHVQAGTVSLAATAGIAYAPPATTTATELLRQATAALTTAERTKSPVEHYHPDEDTSGPLAALVTAELEHAIRADQLILYYQPIVTITDSQPIAAEGTAHWMHPTRGTLPARRFLHILEHTTLLPTYLDWLLREALTDRAAWTSLDADLPVAINLPARCLLDHNLPTQINNALHAAGLQPHQLAVELPADAALLPLSTVDTVLDDLHTLGVRIAIDHFGRGHTPVDRLLRLPATDLKIAPEITAPILTSRDDHTIIRIAREIADGAGLNLTATGITTQSHLHAAHTAGAHAAQGDAICPPLLADRAHHALQQLAGTANPVEGDVIRLHPDREPDPN